MPIAIAIAVLIAGWLGTYILALEPIALLKVLFHPSWIVFGVILSFGVWCFGE